MTGSEAETFRSVSLHIVLVEPEIHFNADYPLKTRNLLETQDAAFAQIARIPR